MSTPCGVERYTSKMPFTMCPWHGHSTCSLHLWWMDRAMSSRLCRLAFQWPPGLSPGSPNLSSSIFYFPIFTPIWMIFSLPHPGSLWFQTSYILSLLQQLSLQVHLTKSHLAPSQTVEYLGVVFHLDTLQITPESKVSRILLTCRGTIRRRTCSWRQLECLVGLLSLASYYDPLGRLKLSPSAG